MRVYLAELLRDKIRAAHEEDKTMAIIRLGSDCLSQGDFNKAFEMVLELGLDFTTSGSGEPDSNLVVMFTPKENVAILPRSEVKYCRTGVGMKPKVKPRMFFSKPARDR